MIPITSPKKSGLTGLLVMLGLLLASCGSYQQASYYDNDGIYARGTEQATERVPAQGSRTQQPRPQEAQDGFYQNYFGEKARQLDQALEGEIFTDADSYSSGREADSLGQVQGNYFQDFNNDYAGNPGWGDRADNVTINLYGGGGWNNWGFYDPWLWNGWGWNNWGWGLGWNNWGWGWGPGWNNWGWGAGWGWGWGAGWGWGWGYPGWGWGYPGWGYPYYRNYGFVSGRRGNYNRYSNINALGARSVMAANNTARVRTNSGRSNLGTSTRYSGVRSNRSTLDAAARNRAYRSTRTTRATPSYADRNRSARTYTGAPRPYSNTRGNTYGNNTYRSRTGGTYSGRTGSYPGRSYQNQGSRSGRSYGTSPGYRSSGSSRSSGGFRSSTGGSSRSSGSFRGSSGGGSRSSGSMRSSGGGGRSSGMGGGRSSGGRSSGRGYQR